MYCVNCGTINPDQAEYCLKCGGGFARTVGAEAPSAVDIALAARPVRSGHSSSTKSSTTGLMVAGLIAVLILAGLMIFALKQPSGVTPRRFSASVVTDAARKANALRLQAAIAQFYAQNDRYPASIAEIPPPMLGFNSDPAIYHYTVLPDSRGFRVEVIMESRNISGGHIVTEGGVTKYVYEGQ